MLTADNVNLEHTITERRRMYKKTRNALKKHKKRKARLKAKARTLKAKGASK
jgi:hypothetical protein